MTTLLGTVLTLDPARPRANGLTISPDGLIVGLEGAGGEGERLPDGAVVLPGFTDAHAHMVSWSSSLREVQLHGTRSQAEVLERVREAAASRPSIVRGFGRSAEDWPEADRTLTREALDAVSGDVPVSLLAHDWHSLWVNSAALALADGQLDVPGGVVERDADGRPTGVLREESAWAFRDAYALPSRPEQIDALRAALPQASRRGVTAVHDKDGMLDSRGVVGALRAELGELPLRFWHSHPADRVEEVAGDDSVGYLKAFMDGTLGSRTARMIGGGGVEVTSREAFEGMIRAAAAIGRPIAVHAIGDQAARDALDAFEASADAWRGQGLRQRIEHAQCVHPDDVPRFAALGITASIQPAMTLSDRAVAERLWADRIERSYAFGTLVRAGARIAGGSDAPVEALDPLAGIRAAVLREWRPEEALDLDTALRAWTAVPAWLEGREGTHGRLAPGFAADLVVLDRDPYADLAGADVIGTMRGGRWTYRGF